MEELKPEIWQEYTRITNMGLSSNCGNCGNINWNLISVERNEINGIWSAFQRCNNCDSLFQVQAYIVAK